jgi:hypothetical protein
MKLGKSIIVISTLLSVPLSAASISTSNGGDVASLLAIAYNNSTLASGGIAAAGYFGSLTDVQVLALSMDIANIDQLTADFLVVGSTTLDSNVPNAGVYAGDFNPVTLPNASKSGNALYSFLGNEATLGASTEWLLWKHTDVIDAQDTITQPDSNSLVVGTEGTMLISGGTFTSSIDFDGAGSDPAVPVNAIRLAAVPEPSTLLLSALGVLGLLRRKR